jgi:hypothetical protein
MANVLLMIPYVVTNVPHHKIVQKDAHFAERGSVIIVAGRMEIIVQPIKIVFLVIAKMVVVMNKEQNV